MRSSCVQRYIDRISELYVDASKDPSSPAHRELHELVTMRVSVALCVPSLLSYCRMTASK